VAGLCVSKFMVCGRPFAPLSVEMFGKNGVKLSSAGNLDDGTPAARLRFASNAVRLNDACR